MKKFILVLVMLIIANCIASDEIWFFLTAEETADVVVLMNPANGYIYDTSASGFAASSSVAWTDRGITVSEDTDNPGFYQGDLPASITAGRYIIRVYNSGGTLESTDTCVKNFEFNWTGSAEVSWVDLQTLADMWITAGIPTNFGSMNIDADGRVDVGSVIGDTNAARRLKLRR